MSEPTAVNRHYLERVIEATRHRTVEASEDIVAGNGMKLLAKGAAIDDRVRERLLEHKLDKPLESSLTVSDGLTSTRLLDAARQALDEHALLRQLYPSRESTVAPLAALRDVRLGPNEQTVLTLYAGEREDKIEHLAVVALLNLSLHQRLELGGHRSLVSALTAALFHDAGELYIEPTAVEASESRRDLNYEPWKQVCVHPVLGHRLLMRLAGSTGAADAEAARAVLEHHERLDGFGYPAALRASSLGVAGRVLAVSEVVAERLQGEGALTAACVALKLIPAEFDRRVVNTVLAACARLDEATLDASSEATAPPLDDALDTLDALGRAIQGYERRRCSLVAELETAPALFREARDRYERILAAFSSTGLSMQQPPDLRVRLAGRVPAPVRLELAMVLREVEHRFAELRRVLKLRVEQVAPAHADLAARVLRTSMPEEV